MPRNPLNPRRRFLSDAERKQADYERKKLWRENNKERAKASVDRFYAANPTARKEKHLSKKYGLSLAAFTDILLLQNKSCGICGRTSPGRKSSTGGEGDWVVDHCHTSGKVRGIICHPCNAAIGFANDDPAILRRIADYLEK